MVVYIFIFIVPPGVVPHSEHDHVEHNIASEHDPCHISIYHQGQDGGCQHERHFTQEDPDCDRCHVTLVRQHVVPPIIWIDLFVCNNIQHLGLEESTFYLSLPDHHDRGPPVSVDC